ncbi:LysR family transcriptional regulator [Emergencia timonensis]|uniref:LysR family transcriptional regulator n=1 Tax=Emergencia timonensis TaxID=1776384 RepID=A0A415E828_9FIRM|nr:LysR family transcriptional regulator [Emergencia timonensis]MBS6179039.1 LysR family transcriptional regulator [Clostridiales bacterium]MCB6477404.1 LysR family transcriptional regulator [Emergencia timonensis]RHJ89946.1 LysR family transcriptional regulator [Emergencia timonensis]BDF08986.1 LysR family transcriptional regulator [Emergencia timonensis]BDF13074.1 LysR family transcriptional regulator [Emergencia timonensis]
MDIQKYEAFIKTAELGSIKKASEALGYTQAGLSYIIKTLEEELDISLFFRDYGKIYLTGGGKELLPLAHAICNDQRRLKTRLSELKNLQSGNITIAVFTSIAVYWLPYLMKGFLEKHPGIRFDVKCYEEPAVLDEMLDNGDVDFGFTVLPDADASFEKVFLKKDPMMIVLAENHPLADLPYFPSSSMSEEPYISVGDHSEMDALFYYNNVKPNTYLMLDNDFAVMSMVSQGFGFSVFPALMLKSPTFPLAVKEPEISFSREIGIVLRSWESASDAARAFITFTKDWISENF